MKAEEKQKFEEKIRNSLEKVRPYLQADGGDIKLIDVTDDLVVKVELTGACHGCPFSIQTLKAGVEQVLIRDVPEVKEVIAVNT
ncbi:MAG TPA: NifU family protein [Bacteroidetes bacterium]|nr:NifU family protein [Bacteroidota bacterium]